MIHPLRQRHRCAVMVLAVALPLVFIAAIVARRPIPVSEPVHPFAITNHAGSETGASR
jgi:hypothetical protein